VLRYDAYGSSEREIRNAYMIVEPGGKILGDLTVNVDYTTKLYLKESWRVWLGFIRLSIVPMCWVL
jgi:hypothetical protein